MKKSIIFMLLMSAIFTFAFGQKKWTAPANKFYGTVEFDSTTTIKGVAVATSADTDNLDSLVALKAYTTYVDSVDAVALDSIAWLAGREAILTDSVATLEANKYESGDSPSFSNVLADTLTFKTNNQPDAVQMCIGDNSEVLFYNKSNKDLGSVEIATGAYPYIFTDRDGGDTYLYIDDCNFQTEVLNPTKHFTFESWTAGYNGFLFNSPLIFSDSLSDGTNSITEFSTDTTLAGNSDYAVPTEKAVKTYVDAKADIKGTYFSIVDASGTPAENGAALLAEYARVKALVASEELTLDGDTRYTLYIPAGQYDLTADFVVDTPYLDVRSLNGECSVYLTTKTINVTADSVNVTGIDVGTQRFKGCDDLANIVITNCSGGEFSFGGSWSGTASGTFENCVGGDGAFGGGGGIASGTFTNCVGGDYSFGGADGKASGTFINCTGGEYSFGGGGDGKASGTFTNCTGGDGAFGGGGGTPSGTFLWCRLTEGSFPTPTGAGYLRFCLDADGTIRNDDPTP